MNTLNRNRGEDSLAHSLPGVVVLDELSRLISELSFTDDQADYRSNDHWSVYIHPWASDTEGCFNAQIRVTPRSPEAFTVQGLRLQLCRSNVRWLTKSVIDTRGMAWFKQLPISSFGMDSDASFGVESRGFERDSCSPEFLSRLADSLQDHDLSVRRHALELLKKLGNAAATPMILNVIANLLLDEKQEIREAAAEAVKNFGGAAATPEICTPLVRLLEDEEEEVQYAAAQAIEKINDAPESQGKVIPLAEFRQAARSVIMQAQASGRYLAAHSIACATLESSEPEPIVYILDDHRVTALLEQGEQGEAIMTVETSADDLADAIVTISTERENRELVLKKKNPSAQVYRGVAYFEQTFQTLKEEGPEISIIKANPQPE